MNNEETTEMINMPIDLFRKYATGAAYWKELKRQLEKGIETPAFDAITIMCKHYKSTADKNVEEAIELLDHLGNTIMVHPDVLDMIQSFNMKFNIVCMIASQRWRHEHPPALAEVVEEIEEAAYEGAEYDTVFSAARRALDALETNRKMGREKISQDYLSKLVHEASKWNTFGAMAHASHRNHQSYEAIQAVTVVELTNDDLGEEMLREINFFCEEVGINESVFISLDLLSLLMNQVIKWRAAKHQAIEKADEGEFIEAFNLMELIREHTRGGKNEKEILTTKNNLQKALGY